MGWVFLTLTLARQLERLSKDDKRTERLPASRAPRRGVGEPVQECGCVCQRVSRAGPAQNTRTIGAFTGQLHSACITVLRRRFRKQSFFYSWLLTARLLTIMPLHVGKERHLLNSKHLKRSEQSHYYYHRCCCWPQLTHTHTNAHTQWV